MRTETLYVTSLNGSNEYFDFSNPQVFHHPLNPAIMDRNMGYQHIVNGLEHNVSNAAVLFIDNNGAEMQVFIWCVQNKELLYLDAN